MNKELRVIQSEVAPNNTNVLWLNTKDNILYKFSNKGWENISKDFNLPVYKNDNYEQLVNMQAGEEIIITPGFQPSILKPTAVKKKRSVIPGDPFLYFSRIDYYDNRLVEYTYIVSPNSNISNHMVLIQGLPTYASKNILVKDIITEIKPGISILDFKAAPAYGSESFYSVWIPNGHYRDEYANTNFKVVLKNFQNVAHDIIVKYSHEGSNDLIFVVDDDIKETCNLIEIDIIASIPNITFIKTHPSLFVTATKYKTDGTTEIMKTAMIQ